MTRWLNGMVSAVMVLIIVHAIWLVAVLLDRESAWLMWLLWGAPAFAAFVASYAHPHRIVISSITIAAVVIVLSLISNEVVQMFGRQSDFVGIQGNLLLVVLVGVYALIFSLLGALAGNYLRVKRAKAHP